MSRQIDFNQPLSAEDREWLHEWSMDWRIEENDRRFGTPEGDHRDHTHADIGNAADASVGDGGAGDDGLTLAEQIASLDVDELKDELKELGESTQGNKDELQERLLKALESR